MSNKNMVDCKACGEEIAKGVKQCPHCGKDQRSFFGRHKILTAIGIVIIIAIIGAAIGGDDSPEDTGPKVVEVETEDKETQDEVESEELSKDIFSIGEAVEMDGQIVKVVGVEKSSGSDFDKPSKGKEYVIVEVYIENNGEEEISYNPFNFKMKNSNGQIESQRFTIIDSDTALSSGDLAPGGNVSGTISFEQPIDDDGLELIFEPNFWKDEKIVFDLSK